MNSESFSDSATIDDDSKEMLSFLWIVRSWLLDCTAHGIPKVISSANFHRKIFWLFAVSMSTGGFLYQITDMIQDVLSHPVAVNVQVKYPDNIQMPTVTICNSNKLKLSSLKKYDKSSSLYQAVRFEDFSSISVVKVQNELRESIAALSKEEANTASNSRSGSESNTTCSSSYEPDWNNQNTILHRLNWVRTIVVD